MYRIFNISLLSFFLIGLGFIFIVPIFENFDEYAHYSRIIETIDHNFSIQQQSDKIDKRIENYQGPMPYGNGHPPFDTHLTYKKFFDEGKHEEFVRLYKENRFTFQFEDGDIYNWQYQHPPFYYFLMGILIQPFENQSLYQQVLLLRIFSYGVVMLSVWITFLMMRNHFSNFSHEYLILFPTIFPMFFIEFARIGNDSICLLICSLIMLFLAKLKSPTQQLNIFTLGLLCGLGMLFKSFFLPIFTGIGLYLLVMRMQHKQNIKIKFKNLLIFSSPYLFITISWFLINRKMNADLGLGSEFNALFNLPITALLDNFNLFGMIRGSLVPIITFTWSGTWSLTRIPIIMQLIFIFPCLLIFWVMVQKIVSKKLDNMELAGIVLIIIFYLSLIAHVFIAQLISGLGTSGGWYIYILFPWIIYLFAQSLQYIQAYSWSKLLTKGLFWLILLNTILTIWFHLCLYAGVATKNNSKNFDFQEPFFGILNADTVLNNNALLSSINIGLPLLLIGYLILIIQFLKYHKIRRYKQ